MVRGVCRNQYKRGTDKEGRWDGVWHCSPLGCDGYDPARCCGHCRFCNYGGRGEDRAFQEDRRR
jgi:hypothetical protein